MNNMNRNRDDKDKDRDSEYKVRDNRDNRDWYGTIEKWIWVWL